MITWMMAVAGLLAPVVVALALAEDERRLEEK